MTLDGNKTAFVFSPSVEVTYNDIINELCSQDYDDLIEFIRELDTAVGDEEFTKMLGTLVVELFKEMKDDDEAESTPPLVSEKLEPTVGHPTENPGDGRTKCPGCEKYIWPVIHSCKGIPKQ